MSQLHCPFGTAELYYIKSGIPIEPKEGMTEQDISFDSRFEVYIIGNWQTQEKLFELGFKPMGCAYRRGELHGN